MRTLGRIPHILIILPLFTALVLSGCGADKPDPVSRMSFCFDTIIEISIYDTDIGRERADEILDECMKTAALYDRTMRPGMSVSDADDETIKLLDTALTWQEKTDGAFDPMLGTLTALWNFSGDPPGPVPSASAVEGALKHTAPSDTEALIDLGGIAKGYIADRLKDKLISEGVHSAVINLGGNVLLLGSKPDGSPFRVGIRDPGDPSGNKVTTAVTVSDMSVVTSGVYERCFEEGGVRYHHILDPATGYPADTDVSSVTVITADSASGDALSTACLVMGHEKGQALIESLPDTEAMFILMSGDTVKTAGFPDQILTP